MAAPVVVILAAGQGTRMRSQTPKLLHPLCGRPMVAWPIAAARDADAAKVVVVGGPGGELADALPEDVVLAVQQEPKGTADAVRSAGDHIGAGDTVIVIAGDVPLITGAALADLAAAHAAAGAAATMATVELDEPAGYGRVVRDAAGEVERVVETKSPGDASDDELAIREVNTGIFAFAGGALLEALGEVRADNAQGELYLPDVLPVLRARGERVAAQRLGDPALVLGVNDRADLARVRAIAQRRILEEHMRAGVTVVDPASTTIDAGVEIGADTVIAPFCSLLGATRIAERAELGPLSTLIDSTVAAGARVVHSYLDRCDVGPSASVGPFAYLRPDAVLEEGAKAGTFVEIKNSRIGPGTKVPHLSYIGDADIGEQTNVGAGTITANYDGFAKHRTTIGARVRISVDTALVAPVTVGDDAFTAAGSVITKDVPDGALGVARARQENIEGYARRRAARDD